MMHKKEWFYKKTQGNDRIREIKLIMSSALIIFVSICLLSYNPHDRSWFFYSDESSVIHNMCGSIGAHIAGTLMYICGGSSLFCLALFIFIVYLKLFGIAWQREWDRLLALGLLIVVGATMSNIYGFDWLPTRVPGGFLGFQMRSLLFYWFDKIGTIIFLYAALMISCILLFRFSFAAVVHYAFQNAHLVVDKDKFLVPAYCYIERIAFEMSQPFVWLVTFLRGLFDGSVVDQAEQSIVEFEQGIYHEQQAPLPLENKNLVQPSRQVKPDAPSVEKTRVKPVSFEPFMHQAQRQSSGSLTSHYQLPNLDIFIGVDEEQHDDRIMQELELGAQTLQEKLERFGVFGSVVSIKRGPVVTLYEYQPQIDTKISKIIALEDDLALALRALSIRIIAPIPGTSVVGFEVANRVRRHVHLAEVVQDRAFAETDYALPLVLGQDTIGANVVVDLAKMPHLLIAGSTGSGKSIALNAMLVSLLCRLTPDQLKLILIDPKRLEFAAYADIAHLLFPIVTDPRKATPALRWVVQEMEQRYQMIAECGARSVHDYNRMAQDRSDMQTLPYIVVIIDELADLMMTASKDIEDLIARIAQMARAAGIHLIVATQRPSVDVITGLIKVNFPSRISFRVTSKIDSRTILDAPGAEKLLGRGDMLFMDSHSPILRRVHGAYVSDQEIHELVDHIRSERTVEYLELDEQDIAFDGDLHEADNQLYQEVLLFIKEIDEVSISLLQRKFRIGYNRSARIMSMLESQGLIMPADGSKTRKVIH